MMLKYEGLKTGYQSGLMAGTANPSIHGFKSHPGLLWKK